MRDWIHVDDHCRAVRLVGEVGEPGEVYHVAGTAELSNLELTGLLLEAMGADWTSVERVPARAGHAHRYSLDDAKLRALGYRPRTTFADGLADTVRWYLDNPSWWKSKLARTA